MIIKFKKLIDSSNVTHMNFFKDKNFYWNDKNLDKISEFVMMLTSISSDFKSKFR